MNFETIVGLEIHVELNTATKLFSSAPNHFGDEPNRNISVICTGQPGSLPLLNKQAVHKAIQFALAVGAKIAPFSTFDRKSYFYPDSPRNFQITQFYQPIMSGGIVKARLQGGLREFAIHHAHLEDDAGMLKHFTNFAGVDYNRAGAPLIEIVSDPCLHSAKEASSYAQALRSIMLYLDACDGNMEEGSLRIDVNISVRLKGETSLRPRIEIKNMNSFTFLEMAIEAEIKRQIALYTDNPTIPPEKLIEPGTYRWDPETEQTVLMRRKESADDYRYFPEPDLVPIVLTQEYIDDIAQNLPELPQDRYKRYINDLGLTPYAATSLINDKDLCDYFEAALSLWSSPRNLCNWITIEFAGRLKEAGKTLLSVKIPPAHIAMLVTLIDQNAITGPIAKAIADEMVIEPGLDPQTIINRNPDYRPMTDSSELIILIDQVLRDNPQSVQDFKAGKEKAFAFLVGQAMKLSRGKASPQKVNELLRAKLQNL